MHRIDSIPVRLHRRLSTHLPAEGWRPWLGDNFRVRTGATAAVRQRRQMNRSQCRIKVCDIGTEVCGSVAWASVEFWSRCRSGKNARCKTAVFFDELRQMGVIAKLV